MTDRRMCKVCGKPIHWAGTPDNGGWVHNQPHDPFAPPIHAPRPKP
jgi:hypothetical protein